MRSRIPGEPSNKPMKTRNSLLAVALATALAPLAGEAATTIALNPVADTAVFHRDGSFAYNTTNYGTATQLDTSQFGSAIWAMSCAQVSQYRRSPTLVTILA